MRRQRVRYDVRLQGLAPHVYSELKDAWSVDAPWVKITPDADELPDDDHETALRHVITQLATLHSHTTQNNPPPIIAATLPPTTYRKGPTYTHNNVLAISKNWDCNAEAVLSDIMATYPDTKWSFITDKAMDDGYLTKFVDITGGLDVARLKLTSYKHANKPWPWSEFGVTIMHVDMVSKLPDPRDKDVVIECGPGLTIRGAEVMKVRWLHACM